MKWRRSYQWQEHAKGKRKQTHAKKKITNNPHILETINLFAALKIKGHTPILVFIYIAGILLLLLHASRDSHSHIIHTHIHSVLCVDPFGQRSGYLCVLLFAAQIPAIQLIESGIGENGKAKMCFSTDDATVTGKTDKIECKQYLVTLSVDDIREQLLKAIQCCQYIGCFFSSFVLDRVKVLLYAFCTSPNQITLLLLLIQPIFMLLSAGIPKTNWIQYRNGLAQSTEVNPSEK